MKKNILITVTTSIAVTVSVTLFVVNVDEFTLFKQEITNNIVNSRDKGNGNKQKDRNRKLKPENYEDIKIEQDTTLDIIQNAEEVFAEEDI